MSYFPPSPSLTLRVPSGVFLIVLSGVAPLSLRRFAFGHDPRGPGQLLLTSMLVGAQHDSVMMHEIRGFYVARGFDVAHKPDYLVLRELAQELEGPALTAYFFRDADLAGVIAVSPEVGQLVVTAGAGPVESWSLQQKLGEMFRLMPGYVPEAVRGEVVAFLSPENLRNMVVFFAVIAAVQAVPGGDAAADAVLVALAWYYYGWAGVVAAYQLIDAVVTVARAKREDDLRDAAKEFATALVALGTVFFLKKLGERVKKGGGKEKTDEPSGSGEQGGRNEPKPARPTPRRISDPDGYVKGRTEQLRSQIPENSRGRITMAVAVVQDQEGAQSVLVGTSEPRGYLRPGVTLNEGESVVPGTGHAEADIVNYAAENNLNVVSIGATRPVCDACQSIIPPDTSIATPLK